MAYKSFNSTLILCLTLFFHFCGVALSDTDVLLEGPERAWYSDAGLPSPQIGSWFPFDTNLYAVCDTSTTDREPTNWLRTDFIDIKDAIRVDVVVNYAVRKCQSGKKYCKETFKLYGLQTATYSPNPNPFQTRFEFLAKAKPTVTPDRQTGPADFNLLNVSIKAKDKRLYLAFYDQGACLSLFKVLVSFNYCPAKGKDNLVTFVRTVSPFNDSSAKQVEGKCSDPHSKNTTVLTAACMSQGNWKMNDSVRCFCQPGYEYSDKKEPHCTVCVSGKYKSETSNTKCQPCPGNSVPDPKRTKCVCLDGYYKLENSSSSAVPCEALPEGPAFVNASIWNGTAVLISWPAVIKVNGSLTYSIGCYKCKGDADNFCIEQCGKGVAYYPRQDGLKTTSATVSGLPSGTKFKFKVYVVTEINALAEKSDWKYASVYLRTKKAFILSGVKTTSGDYCVFPFTHNGVEYKSCTTAYYHSHPWCATTTSYNTNRKWGNCKGFFSDGVKTTSWEYCAFPFVYKGELYNTCTMQNNDHLWCSTTINYDKDKKWGYCA